MLDTGKSAQTTSCTFRREMATPLLNVGVAISRRKVQLVVWADFPVSSIVKYDQASGRFINGPANLWNEVVD
jgi:hypothetical protein